MISKVSFGSTYQFASSNMSKHNTMQKHAEMTRFCLLNKIPVQDDFSASSGLKHNKVYKIDTSIIAPDEKDALVEKKFDSLEIDYTKQGFDDILSSKAVQDRAYFFPKKDDIQRPLLIETMGNRVIINPPIDTDSRQKVILNTFVLNDLILHKANGNIAEAAMRYTDKIKEESVLKLKSNMPFETATISLSIDEEEKKKSFWDIFKKSKKEDIKIPEDLRNLNINIDIDDKNNFGMFFAMQDARLTKIPVYADSKTIKIGQKLGLFE